MKFSIITLFPEVFTPILNSSILKRAQNKTKVEFEIINLRDFGQSQHKTVDDRPYGGGVGMILKADVLTKALLSIKKTKQTLVLLTSASGQTYTQTKAKQLSKLKHLIIICGHYEGVDQRFIEKYVDEEISIGDFILTGGEIPAMVIVDSTTRLIKGVLEKAEAIKNESFEDNLLEYPHYTRPEKFENLKVPEILLSGNHQAIANWRKEKSLEKTKKLRPDLLKKN
ncbi:tRNA (guanosine(37)-N1)-methyltransferase TrmD [Candidatus Daviesbacteria bacterium]|nr:tRNA (guanosine(37)-N1)-methyltransferase TrmD [Candidatus Daviesbacteria bacterium]